MKKKKPELKTEPVRKKKKNRIANPGKKKVKVVKSCSWYCLRVPHVCLITKMSLSYELWKQSYRLPNNFFAMGPTIFEL